MEILIRRALVAYWVKPIFKLKIVGPILIGLNIFLLDILRKEKNNWSAVFILPRF